MTLRKSADGRHALVLASALIVAALPALASDAIDDGRIDAPRRSKSQTSEGIWKAVTPPGSMKGEFNGHDPIGLAAGTLIQADCSINWVNPDNGKLFCFSSGTSLVYFLNWPARNTARAKDGWHKLTVPSN